MGSDTDEVRKLPMFSETPPTKVTITNGFWVSVYKVTQREYFAVMSTNPSGFVSAADHWECPVEQVSYSDASNYCARVTKSERALGRLPQGFTYRLPTEAEWEYFARAGTTTRFFFGDYPNYMKSPTNTPLGDYAWYWNNAGKHTHPVGLKKPNPWGLYDIYGNVCEWVIDRVSPYPGGELINPVNRSGTNSLGISFPDPSPRWGLFRSGSWNNFDLRGLRSGARIGQWPTLKFHDLGFRVVLAPIIPKVWAYQGQ
jgi:formylglycine-generating enzyme required for sulfatase activity